MKVMKKIISVVLVASMMVACLAGCGKKEAVVEEEHTVYAAEYLEWDMGDGYASGFQKIGNILYTLVTTYDEDSSSTSLASFDLSTNESKVVPVTLEKGSYVNQFVAREDETFLLLISKYDENDPNAQGLFSMITLDKDGNQTDVVDLNQILTLSPDSGIGFMLQDKDSNLYFGDYMGKVSVFSKDLQKLFETDFGDYLSSTGLTGDGTVIGGTWGQNGMEIKEIDVANKGLGKTFALTNSNGINCISPCEGGFLYSDSSNLISVDTATGEESTVLNYINCDIDADNIVGVIALEDAKYCAVTLNYDEESAQTNLIILSPMSSADVVEKETLTFATMYLDSSVKKEIVKFNQNNEQYRIEVKEYATNDWEEGMKQFNMDITSSNAPDLIDLTSLNSQSLANKGALEDLYPYMDKDADINKEDYLQNVFKACEVNGKLYSIIPGFTAQMLMMRSSDAQGKEKISIDDIIAMIDEGAEGMQPFPYSSSSMVLYYCIFSNLSEYINWETGECSFDTEDFKKVLEFSKRFPKDIDYDNAESEPKQIQSGKALMESFYLSDINSYIAYSGMFNEEVSLVGFPSKEGNGLILSPCATQIAISSKSENKDAAWEFVKCFLGSDYQENSNNWGFPIQKAALEKVYEEAMNSENTSSWGYDDFEIEIGAATEEQIAAVRKVLESVDTLSTYDSQISTIIDEETEPFLQGQKSADEVADIIQSRAQIYVSENR